MIDDNIKPFESPDTACGTKIHAQHEFQSVPDRAGHRNPTSYGPWCCYCQKNSHEAWDCWSTTTFLCNCGRCTQHRQASSVTDGPKIVKPIRPIFSPGEMLRKSSVNNSLIQNF